jgi:hypothetical protein
MTLAEFKAWFEGFTEDMDGAPNDKQWKRIKARVKEIDGVAVTKTVFVDRYLPSYPEPYRRYWGGDIICGVSTSAATLQNAVASGKAAIAEFDSHVAMVDLGKADYASIAA